MGTFLIFFLFPTPALAYLDPGTGSIVAQAAIALVLGVIFQWKMLWRRFTNFLETIVRRRNT